jgi:hypothetical protein
MATQQRSEKARASSSRKVEGEGSYSATRRYNKHLGQAAADEVGIKRGAQAARKAVEGPEGAELRAAEKKGKAGPRAVTKRTRAN